MPVHALPHRRFPPPNVALTVEIIRALSEFRLGYDERILQRLHGLLLEHMEEGEADSVMSDAMALDNEVRFRRPRGLAVAEPGAVSLSSDEEALILFIAHAADPEDPLTMAMAQRLGIGDHQALRECASALERSLSRGGVEIEWGLRPAERHIPSRAVESPGGICP